MRQTAELAAKDGAPVYLYQWALEATVLDGARHGDNMRYEVCEPWVLDLSPGQKDLARTLNAYVTSFIVSGNPNSPKGLDRSRWETYVAGDPRAMVFGARNKELVGGLPGPEAMVADTWAREECKFWWSKVELSQQ